MKSNFKNVMLVLLFSQTLFAQNQPYVTLSQAIRTALEKNPRTQANKLQLDAAAEDLKKQKISAYSPTVSIGSTLTHIPIQYGAYAMHSRSSYVSVDMNIFNGFADYYRIKARQCSNQKLEAMYNSTNTLMQNTSGQIVGLVANYFVGLAVEKNFLDFFNKTQSRLQTLSQFAKNEEQRLSIKNAMNNLNVSIQTSALAIKTTSVNYEATVNESVPSEFDTLENTLKTVNIPLSKDEALQIAMTKNPEILSSKLNIECQKYNLKVEQAAERAPRVDVGVQRVVGNGYAYNQASVTISKSFDLGSLSTKGQALRVSSAENDLDGSIADVRKDLTNNYIQYESKLALLDTYKSQLEDSEQLINERMLKLNQSNVEDINILLQSIQTGSFQKRMYTYQLQEIINLKFQIQRNIGTLFDQIK